LREALLDAAARVIARQGYQRTKIQDIVREAGLSSGAVYGRFRSKDDLVREAIITRSVPLISTQPPADLRVADRVAESISDLKPGLSDTEALLLEAYITASRDPAVAETLAEVNRRWNAHVKPEVDAAVRDGTVADGVDPEAALFLVRTLYLGRLLHRGSRLPGPDQAAWEDLLSRVIASFGSPPPSAMPSLPGVRSPAADAPAAPRATAARRGQQRV
jgi:AcrR family transcriptional regulator